MVYTNPVMVIFSVTPIVMDPIIEMEVANTVGMSILTVFLVIGIYNFGLMLLLFLKEVPKHSNPDM